MPSLDDKNLEIAILGGGISGLALAVGLTKKPHISATVYESVPEHKDVGAGLALHLNAIKAMTLIGEELRQAYSDRALNMGEEDVEMATHVILAQGPNSGEVVAELGKAKGRKTVARHELMQGFVELLPKGTVKFGKKADKIEETSAGVKVTFTDGDQITADCVIGADGVHSITRAYILGPDHPAVGAKNHDGYQNYQRTLSMDEARAYGISERLTRIVPILCGPRGHINTMPLDKGRKFSINVARRLLRREADDGSAVPPFIPEDYDDYTEDARAIIRMIADDVSNTWSYATHDHAPIYHRGRVCMVGDAAHCMYPFAGNGAAQALEDCAVLDHLFSKMSNVSQLEKAFAAYDAIRRPRSQAVVDISREFGRIYSYAKDNMHEDPERMRAFFKEAAAFTNNADLAKQNQDAMDLYLKSLDMKSGAN